MCWWKNNDPDCEFEHSVIELLPTILFVQLGFSDNGTHFHDEDVFLDCLFQKIGQVGERLHELDTVLKPLSMIKCGCCYECKKPALD
jgi:hypothetical protein